MNNSRRVAIIDLGTNTFHLLLAEITGISRWDFLLRERIFINLASEGIDWIGDAPMERGVHAMEHFSELIRSFSIDEVAAVGTAALRVAGNSNEFQQRVLRSTGIEVEVITGEREAELIAKGVQAALPDIHRPVLIMDIGGGSVEMILMREGDVLFEASFPVGVAVLYEQFHHEEPIGELSIARLDNHLEAIFAELLVRLQSLPETVLVGASGTFEVVESIIDPHKEDDAPPYSMAKPIDFTPIYTEFTGLDLEARLAHPAIPESRAKYIVVAVHLIQFMLKRLSSDIFYTSAYAMKEGIVIEKSMGHRG